MTQEFTEQLAKWEMHLHQLGYRKVVTCKDCVKSQYDFMTKGYWCDGKQVSENHYCGYAERKSDDA